MIIFGIKDKDKHNLCFLSFKNLVSLNNFFQNEYFRNKSEIQYLSTILFVISSHFYFYLLERSRSFISGSQWYTFVTKNLKLFTERKNQCIQNSYIINFIDIISKKIKISGTCQYPANKFKIFTLKHGFISITK